MQQTPFNLDFAPKIGVAEEISTGLQRLVAPNPSPMTFTGTNTYILGRNNVAIIDPGPDCDEHFQAIVAALDGGRTISHIFVTHTHLDHSPLARKLSDWASAPIYAFGGPFAGRSKMMDGLAASGDIGGGEGQDADFQPNRVLRDGDLVQGDSWSLRAIWTPGHIANHLCFEWIEGQGLFSGDHVMGWATSMVSPPDGDLTAFMGSLVKLQAQTHLRTYFPGHGDIVDRPSKVLDYIYNHRKLREDQILAVLRAGDSDGDGDGDVQSITREIYTEIDKRLIPAAARNVLAHLIDLSARGIAEFDAPLHGGSTFRAR
jgi:glyoxylase-like metal-dependent hydrolase (beta-lactamase superfamily II)